MTMKGVSGLMRTRPLFCGYDIISRLPVSVIPRQVAPQQSLRPFGRNFTIWEEGSGVG